MGEDKDSSSSFPLLRDRDTKLPIWDCGLKGWRYSIPAIINANPIGYTHFHALDDLSSWEGPAFGFAHAKKS